MNKPENRFKHIISAVTTLLKVKQPENDLLFTVKLLVYALNINYMDLICLAAK
jgi:N-glycosylase/DNA lyase